MAKKKAGFTNKFEENALRESALIISEKSQGMFSDLVTHRINATTIILINPNKDRDKQVNDYLTRLESNRFRY